MDLITKLGSALYETHGALCEELINAGYNLDTYYDGYNKWGDFDRVLVMVAHIRGALSYEGYLKTFDVIKKEHDHVVSRPLYARLTGIKSKTPTLTQTERTRRYRQNQNAELQELRALRWIDDNTKLAIDYIKSKYSNLL